MIQIQILSGQQAGSDIAVRRFPFLIGRSAEAQLRLDDAGVWERHLEIRFERHAGFTFAVQSDARAVINAEPVHAGTFRNGDLIELGSVRLRFWLARGRQKTLRVREVLTWAALFGLFGAQFTLIWWLLR